MCGRQSDSTIEYMGGVVMFLAEAEDTDGGSAKSAFLSKLGNDPRSPLHEAEDETQYLLERKIKAYLENRILRFAQGECLFLPWFKPHGCSSRSPRQRLPAFVQPVGIKLYFCAMGWDPFDAPEVPKDEVTNVAEGPAYAMRGDRLLGYDGRRADPGAHER